MTQSERILSMLQMLSEGKRICTVQTAEQFGTDKRTLQRDMTLLKKYLKSRLHTPVRGCYELTNTTDPGGYLLALQNSDDIRPFFEFISLFDDRLFSLFDQETFPVIKQIRRETKVLYHILGNPIERLESPWLAQIKEAIMQRRYADVTFHETKRRDLHEIKPIKIVFAEGNWYLAALTANYKANGGFKFIRINFITGFKLLPNTFQRQLEAEKFIENFRSLFQDYITPSYEVRLAVDASIARYFKVKQFFKTQRIEEEKSDGDLIVSYRINNEMELLPFIKKWLPHIRILSPDSLKKRMKEDILRYLARME